MKMVVFKYGELQNTGAVRRYFAAKFFPKHPRKVPAWKAFKRVIDWFHLTGNIKKRLKVGRLQEPEENIERVKVFFEENEDVSVRKAAQEMGLGCGTVLKILKKKLKRKSSREIHKFSENYRKIHEIVCKKVKIFHNMTYKT